ncbi:MAG: transposase [Prochloraceae cyanobacterium]|nr:transposase [Prochloraceae cyanobacterium]
MFDEEFQIELGTIFKDSTVGKSPIPPAPLALATILQAYMGISDDEVIEELEMDRRWQLVLDCLDCEQAPFSKATLVRFRAGLMAKGFDRRLIERTIEIAHLKKGFCPRYLRGALDSSPLWGAARVEDTYNLLGHALRKALTVIARFSQRELEAVAAEARAEIVASSSLKAALDLDWDDPVAKAQALATILQALEQVESLVREHQDLDEATVTEVKDYLNIGRQIQAQDVEEAADGSPKLRKGVAKDRRISIEDGHMRHGRKSRSKRFDGYKRHVLKDLDSGERPSSGNYPSQCSRSFCQRSDRRRPPKTESGA